MICRKCYRHNNDPSHTGNMTTIIMRTVESIKMRQYLSGTFSATILPHFDYILP